MSHTTIESLVITLLAALIGLSFPIFVQIINSLDSKYDSGRITNRFKREPSFITFSSILFCLFLWLIYLPWAPPAPIEKSNSWFWINSAHIIAEILLIITFFVMIWMVYMTFTYFHPEGLLKHIAPSAKSIYNSHRKFGAFIDLLNYFICKEYIEPYLKCNEIFENTIGIYREDKNGTITYPSFIYQGINDIVRRSLKLKVRNPNLSNPVNYIVSIFDSYDKTLLSNESFICLWNNVSSIGLYGLDNWIRSYWAYANQHAISSDLNLGAVFSTQSNNSVKECHERFIELHYMLGAYLLYQNRVDLLRELIRFQSSSFDRRLLVPHTLKEIIDLFRRIESSQNDYIYLLLNYSFHEEHGVSENNWVCGWLMKYCIFCLLEELKINPNTEDSIFFLNGKDLDEKGKELVVRFKFILYSNIDYFTTLGVKQDYLEKSLGEKFKDLENEAENEKKKRLEEATLSSEEFEKLEDNLQKVYTDVLNLFPNCETENSASSNHFQTGIEVNKETLAYFKDDFLLQTPKSFQSYLMQTISQIYLSKLHSPQYTFNIKYEEVTSAINALNLDSPKIAEKYIIITTGGVKLEIKNISEYKLTDNDTNIYICSQLQTVKIKTYDSNLTIDENKGISSYNIEIKGDVKLLIPNQLRFIKLHIDTNPLTPVNSQISLLKNISSLLPTQV